MTRKTPGRILVVALALIVSVGVAGAAKKTGIPAHPSKLKYDKLTFEVPDADDYKYELKGGNRVYIAEDHALPLVSISINVRTGSFLEPDGMTGLAGMTGAMMRRGGTASMTAEEFDERADFLAANMSSFIGDTSGGASMNCITRVLDDCLDLFFDMLRNPRFQQDRLDVEKDNFLEQLKQRNDDARDIAAREWDWLLYGMDHFYARRMTQAELDSMGRDDLVEFHSKYWRPDQMSFAVSGDVNPKAILAELDQRMADWKVDGPPIPWPPPAPASAPQPGLYHAEKDIPQGRVNIGHLTVKRDSWDNPDYFAMSVMNDILGGGGFTSRIMKRVRSDEGLAYSAGSSIRVGQYWPGLFRMGYQSKSPTVAQAASICLEEMKRIREEAVTDKELSIAKNSFIDTFPNRFESPAQIVNTFLNDEYVGRPHSYWVDYRDNFRKVDAAAVQKAAKKFLHPDKLLFLIVGKWEEIEGGDADGRASMEQFYGGKVTHLPERNPLTLEPVQE